MSSILKALKKVEVETADQNDVLTLPQGLDARAALRRRARDKRFPFYTKALAAFAGSAILLAIGWYFLPGQKTPAEPPAVASKAAERPDMSQPAPPLRAARERQRVQSKKPRPRNQPSREEVTPRKPPSLPPVSAQPVQPTAVPPPATGPTAATRTGTGATSARIPVLPSAQGKLTLQAISWAQNSSGRMAVINNQIVREGGAVDGFTVTDIGPDEVVVRRGTEDWRLIFSLKAP